MKLAVMEDDMKIDISRDWCKRRARLEGDQEVGAGFETMPTPHQQHLGVAWDIIEQAINTYDSWMLDDDFDANTCLKKIIEQMRERRALYHPHYPLTQK